jgi:hypothetical protein
VQRFVAYVVGFIAMFGFAVLAPILAFSGAVIWPVRSASEDLGKQRAERSKALREEQTVRLGGAGTDAASKATHVPVRWAMESALPQLKKKVAAATTAVVPGSATAIKGVSAPPVPVAAPKAPEVKASVPEPKPAAASQAPAVVGPKPTAVAPKPAAVAPKPAAPVPVPSPAIKPALVPAAPASSPKP